MILMGKDFVDCPFPLRVYVSKAISKFYKRAMEETSIVVSPTTIWKLVFFDNLLDANQIYIEFADDEEGKRQSRSLSVKHDSFLKFKGT